MKKYHFCSILMLVIIFTYSSISFAEHRDQIVKEFNVEKGQLLYLETDFGSVEVNSWDRNIAKITVYKKARVSGKREAEKLFNDFVITFDQTNRGIEIEGKFLGPKRWFGFNNRLNIHYEIIVPTEFDLDIHTSGGSIHISDLIGQMDLYTSGGSISAGEVEGSVNAKTSGGSINVNRVNGAVNVNTSGGSISLGETSGTVTAKTSGGSIKIDGAGGDTNVHTSGGGLNLRNLKGNLNASTSGGSIYAQFIGMIDRDCSLKTSGGGITIILPQDISAEVDAHTSGGHVSTDFPVTVRGKLKSNTLYGTINNGGPILKLRTSGGSISIKQL